MGVSPRTVWRALWAVFCALAALGLAVEIPHHTRDVGPALQRIVELFSLSEEGNVPTWWASCLLAGCAVLLALLGARAGRAGAPHAARWWGLAAAFLWISMDEAVQIHEHLNDLVRIRSAGGLLYFGWVLPAAAVVIALAVFYVPFLRDLPPRTRRRFLLAGVLYVGGALAMELPLGWWAARAGEDSLGYVLIDWVEETLELAGATLFLGTLLDEVVVSPAAARAAEGATVEAGR